MTGRMRRMRNWVEGPHFPNAARVEVQTSVSAEAHANLGDEHKSFLSALASALVDCEWTDVAIADSIRTTIEEEGIGGRDAYVALYWAILGKHHGPKASSLMAEMESEHLLSLISET